MTGKQIRYDQASDELFNHPELVQKLIKSQEESKLGLERFFFENILGAV